METGTQTVLAWMAIGLCASIGGWIWPFRRGLVAMAVTAALALAGAVAGGGLSYLSGGTGTTRVTTSFLWATVGAIGTILAEHIVASYFTRARARHHR